MYIPKDEFEACGLFTEKQCDELRHISEKNNIPPLLLINAARTIRSGEGISNELNNIWREIMKGEKEKA